MHALRLWPPLRLLAPQVQPLLLLLPLLWVLAHRLHISPLHVPPPWVAELLLLLLLHTPVAKSAGVLRARRSL